MSEPELADATRDARAHASGSRSARCSWPAGAFTVIAVGGIGKNLVYYWGPTELREAGDKAYGATIRLGGMVAPARSTGRGGVSGLEFDVTDGTDTVHVNSRGVPPQMFRENIGVVVEGTMTRAGNFKCTA